MSICDNTFGFRDKTVSVSLTTLPVLLAQGQSLHFPDSNFCVTPSRLNFGKSPFVTLGNQHLQTPIGRSTLVQTPLLMPTVANSLGASTFANSLGVSTL